MMDQGYSTKGGRKDLLPVFLKLFGIVLAICFLAACSKNGPDVELPEDDVEYLDLSGVDIDLEAGTITGTTTAMEYSLTSDNGVNGTWIVASNESTAVTFVEGKVYIREASNHQNVRMVKTIGPDNTIIVDLEEVGVNVVQGNITGTSVEMEYSLNSTNGADGTWTAASNVNTAVTFVAGNVYVREIADPSNMRLVATIALPAPAPDLLGDDEANTITGLTEIHEYKIDNGPWTAGTIVPDLTGTKVVQVRVKATASVMASDIQTIAFTENNDSSIIVLFEHNFDDGELVDDLKYHPVATLASISGNQYVSGTKSLAFGTTGTRNVGRYFNPDNIDEKYENVTVELMVRLDLQTTSQSAGTLIGLYNGTTRVAVVYLFGANLQYYTGAGSGTLTNFNPVSPVVWDEWFKIRIEMVGATFNVYKNDVLIGSGLGTIDGATEVNRLYLSATNANANSYFDDIKVSYK